VVSEYINHMRKSWLNKYNILRIILLGAGLGWGLMIVGAFLPWEWATDHLV